MTGDFTRNTFRPERSYSAVRMQQGRVLLDADWNESGEIARWFAQATNGDVIGPCGFPQDNAGFGIVSLKDTLALTPGRGYVNGRLVVNGDPAHVRLERVSGNGANTVYKVAVGPALQLGQLLPPTSGELTQAVQVTELSLNADGAQEIKLSATLGAGATKNRVVAASYRVQPHLPANSLPNKDGHYLAYLEVWDRALGVIEDPSLREVALGGPDTCGRDKRLWQVKLHSLDGVQPTPPSCKSFGPGWRPEGKADPAHLAARAVAASAAEDPCALPPAGGYRSLENHLYRVEIHNGGVAGNDKVTFKWSRDNAMHRAKLLEVSDGALVVDSPGKDDVTAFGRNDWLEVLDEDRILSGEPGFFVRLGDVNGTRLSIEEVLAPDTLQPMLDNGAADTAVLPARGQVRRWEGGAPEVLNPGTWQALENGVEITALKGNLRTADYWTVPARSIPADIEWPKDPSSGAPQPVPPEGIRRDYCALAILRASGGAWEVVDDCRHLFPPLSDMETFHYLGGDGQEIRPDLTQANQRVALPAPLRVGVARGAKSVEGRLVRFTVTANANNAALAARPGNQVVSASQRELIVKTNSLGVAEADLSLHPRRYHHHVTAELLDASVPSQADPSHLAIHFNSTLSVADQVAYDPSRCGFQNNNAIGPAATTVQAAIDKLCPTPVLRLLGGNAQLLCLDAPAPEPLRFGLFWGDNPYPGENIDLKVESGDVKLSENTVQTNAEGLAEVKIIAGSDPLLDSGVVRIRIEPTGDAPLPRALIAHARFPNADCLYVNKDVCPPAFEETGELTVASVLTHLCEREGGAEPQKPIEAMHVVGVELVAPMNGEPQLTACRSIDPRELAKGIRFILDKPIEPKALSGCPVGKISFDPPRPPPDSRDSQFFLVEASYPFMTEYELIGRYFIGDKPQFLEWQPENPTARWLSINAQKFLTDRVIEFGLKSLPARATLHGTRIFSAENPEHYLDGDLLINPTLPEGAIFPSGNGTRGGDFVLPFAFTNLG